MRNLNPYEQNVIKRLIVMSDTQIPIVSNLLPSLEDLDLFIDYQKKKVEIRADEEYFTSSELIDKVRMFSLELTVIVNLLNDLIKNGFISTLQESQEELTFKIGKISNGKSWITYPINDSEISNLIIRFFNKSILVNDSLIAYYKRNYQTQEQYRQKLSIYIAIAALITGVLISGAALTNDIFTARHGKESEKAITNKLNDIDSLLTDKLQTVDKRIDSTNSHISKFHAEFMKEMKKFEKK